MYMFDSCGLMQNKDRIQYFEIYEAVDISCGLMQNKDRIQQGLLDSLNYLVVV